jgi:hypothetical protein
MVLVERTNRTENRLMQGKGRKVRKHERMNATFFLHTSLLSAAAIRIKSMTMRRKTVLTLDLSQALG